MERQVKHKWKGVFNFQYEVSILYAYAYTERQAWMTFCRRLANKHNVGVPHVMGIFDGSKDNFTIEKEK